MRNIPQLVLHAWALGVAVELEDPGQDSGDIPVQYRMGLVEGNTENSGRRVPANSRQSKDLSIGLREFFLMVLANLLSCLLEIPDARVIPQPRPHTQ